MQTNKGVNTKILVIGGTGFIGSKFVYLSLEKRHNCKVVCVDCLTYAANINKLKKHLKILILSFIELILEIEKKYLRFLRLKNLM